MGAAGGGAGHVGFVGIAGSAAEADMKSGKVVAKVYEGPQFPDGAKGHLHGVVQDIWKVQDLVKKGSFFEGSHHPNNVYHTKLFTEAGSKTSKGAVLVAIEELFKSQDVQTPCARHPHIKVLFYSGHGMKDTGDWCFENENGVVTERITFEEVLALWQQNTTDSTCNGLCILIDACFSGAWVEKAKSHNLENVIIQASSSSTELSYCGAGASRYTSTLGGVNLCSGKGLVFEADRSGWAALGSSLGSNLVFEAKEEVKGQTPCCYPVLSR